MTEAQKAQTLLKRIGELEEIIKSAGDDGRGKLADINLAALRAAIPPTEAAWADLTEVSRRVLHERLANALEALELAAKLDGPTDPKHVMYGAYASTLTIVLWVFGGFALVASLLFLIIAKWDTATDVGIPALFNAATVKLADLEKARGKLGEAERGEQKAQALVLQAKDEGERDRAKKQQEEGALQTRSLRDEARAAEDAARHAVFDAVRAIKEKGPQESLVLTMVCLLRALGGSLHYLGSVVKFVGNRQLKRSWLLYYLSLPFVGAALAPVVYMLLRIGILTPSGTTSGAATSNLNLIGIYAFAALTGMFAKTATDKLGEVFGTLFRTAGEPLKDRLVPAKRQEESGGPVPSRAIVPGTS